MTRESSDPLRVEGTRLGNGLEVFRQAPPPAARSFSATFVSAAGWACDGELGGLAALVSATGAAAAGTRDRVALAQVLDRHGAVLTHHCDPESAEVTVWGPEESLVPLLGLLADVVLAPRFEREDLERVRRQLYERQLRELSQPESRADRALLSAVFPPDHPYAKSGAGTHESVARVHRADLVRFHERHVTAAGGQLVLTARPGLATIARLASRGFRDLPAGSEPAARPVARAPRGKRPQRRRLSMPGRAQVEIRVGGASIARSDPSYAGAFLANEVLGGRALLSRLFQNVREKEGLAYHASSSLEAMRWGGYWEAQAGTGPERVDAALRLLYAEVDRIRHERIRGPELERMRESTIGELPLALETTQGAHELALDVAYHHLGETFLTAWPSELRRLSPESVRTAAAEAFPDAGTVTVLAGPIRPLSGGAGAGSTRVHAHHIHTHK